jgi:hypothetical protein
MDVLFTGWDAQCAGLEAVRQKEAEWKEKEVWEPVNGSDGGWGVYEGNDWWVGSDERLFNTLYAMYRGVWPSMLGGVEVTVDVHLVLEGSLASYDTALSVLPMQVAHPVVPVEEFTHSSSPASMLPAALSEALGISLADVMGPTTPK